MVRLWCRSFADQLDFSVDYQPWVVANFSGILCVDEVYQGELALPLAVDPAAIWKDDLGRRRTPDEAEQRYFIWQADSQAATLAPLRRQQQHLDADHCARLSA